LAFAAAPIIIHLLSRRKFRELDWAAMKWLLAAIQKNARRIQLEQLILLAVRTLLVLCVVLAMAKPFLEGAGAVLLPGKRTHRILVIDGSFSMGYRLTDRDRFDRAKQVAGAILQDARKGDAASLVLMAAPPRIVVGEPSANLAAVADEVRSLELPHGEADLAATFAKLDEILAQSNLEQKEIYFITDLQKASWASADGAATTPLQDLAAKIAARANIVLIDLGQGSADNLAITALDLEDPLVTVGRDTRFSATFRNFGRTNRSALSVTMNVDGDLQDRRSIDLPAGEQTSIVLSQSFASPGRHLVELILDDDSLAIDNHRWLAVNAKENIDVLLVDGEPSGERFGSETDYLRFALAPEVLSADTKLSFRPEVIRESEFLDTDLARFDCVVFANVGQFTDSEARVVQGFLRGGGGVIWFLGDQVESQSYNRVLFRDGHGILPVQLGSRAGDSQTRQKFVLFDPRDYSHPIVQPFRGATQGGLLTTKVFEYVRTELPAESSAQVALTYEGGDPAIVTAPMERGRVAIVTTSADIEWTNWPFWPSYVPVMNELINYVIADRQRDRTVLVGETLASPVVPSAVETPVTIELPGKQLVARRMPPHDEVDFFLYDQTGRSGGYRVSFGPPVATEDLFAVNVDSRESDLARIEPDELRERFPSWRFVYLTNWQAIASGQSSVTENRGELHRYFLFGALILMFIESFLAWKFGHYA
jgi:von Willebrand factor type A domain/Aerotolerance regulator N-terminal